MPIAKNFLTDTVATNIVTSTVNSITSLIPGVTCKPELAGLISASTAEFFFNLKPAVYETSAGQDFGKNAAGESAGAQVGSKKAVLPLTRAFHMDEKVTGFAIDTTGADVLNDRIAKGSIAMANRIGATFMTDLLGLAQAKEVEVANADFYLGVVEALKVFSTGSSAKVGGQVDTTYSNAENGIQPTTIVVGDVGRSKLFANQAFQRLIGDSNQNAIPGLIGSMLGLQVVYSQHLTGVDFLLVNPEGVAYPYSLNTLRVVESEDFNGVRVQGEVVLPDAGSWAILPIDSYAMKFSVVAPE
jgi:hypothetical protein